MENVRQVSLCEWRDRGRKIPPSPTSVTMGGVVLPSVTCSKPALPFTSVSTTPLLLPIVLIDSCLASIDLTYEDRVSLDSPLDPGELRAAAAEMANNKSPGVNGLPIEFYRLFSRTS